MDNKETLINELRNCAEQLTKLANESQETVKEASEAPKASTERQDYMHGVMVGLGLEE